MRLKCNYQINIVFLTGVKTIKKNFNLKNIKNEMTELWTRVNDDTKPETVDDYIEFMDGLHTMHVYGFISWDEWNKIFEHGTKLFNGEI